MGNNRKKVGSTRAGEPHVEPGRETNVPASTPYAYLNLIAPLLPILRAPTSVQVAIASVAVIQAFGGTILLETHGEEVHQRVAFDWEKPLTRLIFATSERAVSAATLLLEAMVAAGAVGTALWLLDPEAAERWLQNSRAEDKEVLNRLYRDGWGSVQ